MAKILTTKEEKMLEALLGKMSIICRSDGKFVARCDSKRWGKWLQSDVFDTAWQALEYVRYHTMQPELPWNEVPMDERTRDHFLNPRH